MRERFKHISTLESFTSRDYPGFNRWSDTRIDRWLVDWSLRNGKEQTARMIAEDRNIEVGMVLKYFIALTNVAFTETCRYRFILRYSPD